MYLEPIKAIIMGKIFKVMVVGEPGFGKISLLMRILDMSLLSDIFPSAIICAIIALIIFASPWSRFDPDHRV